MIPDRHTTWLCYFVQDGARWTATGTLTGCEDSVTALKRFVENLHLDAGGPASGRGCAIPLERNELSRVQVDRPRVTVSP